MSESSRNQAIERMMNELGYNEREATLEIKRRLKAVKGIIALGAYYNWARENELLLGGPVLKTVNYQRVGRIIEKKPYGEANNTLVLTTWDILDLANVRTFNEYRKESGVTLPLDEVLLLTRAEYRSMKATRASLLKRRKKHETDDQ